MFQRVIVAIVGIPVLAYVVLWAPPVVMLIALCVLAGIAGMELQQCVSGVKWNGLAGMSAVFSTLTVWWYYALPKQIWPLFLFETVILFAYAIWKAGEIKFNQMMAALFSGIAVASSLASFLRLEAFGFPRAYLLLPFILSFACDTFAYFAGRAFGKHKLAPKVSPNKTVEGSIGGILGNIVCGLLFAFVMDQWFDSGIPYGLMVILAVLCSIVAQIGDLSFSLIKREFGIKDYGRLFLAHGGVLDRFDSVLFVTPVIEAILWGSIIRK